MIQRNYERALPYQSEDVDGSLRLNDERREKTKVYRPYLVRNVVIIAVDEMGSHFDASMQRSSAAGFAAKLVRRFIRSMIQIIFGLLQKVTAMCG